MRSLFLKIFLWCWLGMILANVALFLSVAATRPERSNRPWRDLSLVGSTAQKAADTYDREGAAALSDYLQQFQQTNNIDSLLVNDEGKTVSEQALPQGWQELAKKVASSGITQFSLSSTGLLVAQQVITPNGQRFVYVARIPRSQANVNLTAQALRLLAVLLTGGLLYYGLARYLTTPIRQLRETTHEFADGNLAARVGPKLIKRHDEIAQLGRDFNLMAE